MRTTSVIRTLYGLFFVSGFCGLIYESIWSHYLKLFLGHAAYAQTLVLIVFIGGLALGAYAASVLGQRIKRPLLWYAAAEFIVGVIALLFHRIFVNVTGWALDSVLPAVCSADSPCSVQWLIAAMLLLPQSVLLGTTFPFMVGGILRLQPSSPGNKLASLYFLNSIGAVFGVLGSAFVLIPTVGLPGSLMTAGICNIVLAMVVYFIATRLAHDGRQSLPESSAATAAVDARRGRLVYPTLLAIAALTGLSSFMYEIVWIRMLSLVLGSSTHSFELMLSSFILGLALGGLWIRNRIDRIQDAVKFLAIVQIIMGLFALGTLPGYNYTFDLMEWVLSSLARTDSGYVLYNIASSAICLLVMLPATILAGMTLPLITLQLMRLGVGERGIGQVYAVNTVGAILGVVIAVHLALPLTGLKGVLVAAAAIDVVLGVVLLAWFAPRRFALGSIGWSAAGVIGVALIAAFSHIDPYRLVSSVYRKGVARASEDTKVLFLQDGKTATVTVQQFRDGYISIATNGKVDAALSMGEGKPVSMDEYTMALAAAVPLAYRPNIETAAIIGFGSGMSTASLLGSPRVKRVDTIEIEPQMIEGAKHYLPLTKAAYEDPRSNLVIDDAKSYFARGNRKYDLIISEPSNPWVSGVASLFTVEFYQRSSKYLSDDGLLVQWIQAYEITPALVGSIVKALKQTYPHFEIYLTNKSDLLFVASKVPMRKMSDEVFRMEGMKTWLDRLGIQTLDQLRVRRIASERLLMPLIESYEIGANSDYFPIVDSGAPRARFKDSVAGSLTEVAEAAIPIVEMLDGGMPITSLPLISGTRGGGREWSAWGALLSLRFLLGDEKPVLSGRDTQAQGVGPGARAFRSALLQCSSGADADAVWDTVLSVAAGINGQLAAAQVEPLWTKIQSGACFRQLGPQKQEWVKLFQAVGQRDAKAMTSMAEGLLGKLSTVSSAEAEYLVQSAMTGYLALGDREKAKSVLSSYSSKMSRTSLDSGTMRILARVAGTKPPSAKVESASIAH